MIDDFGDGGKNHHQKTTWIKNIKKENRDDDFFLRPQNHQSKEEF